MAFYDRNEELSACRKLMKSDRQELLVLYGRKRVGKTALISECVKECKGIYFVGIKAAPRELFLRFSRAVAEFLGARGITFDDWEAALRSVFERSVSERIYLVLDEFQYLAEASPELPSILQMFLDEYQNKGRLKVVLCGSSISFMEGILSYANPLYGRNTMKLRLLPVTFDNAREFIPRSDFHRLLEVYSVIGGIPMYLNLWDENKSVFENILQLFLEVGAPLREEPIFILMSELREPRIYQSILEALSMGRNTPSEISSYVGFSDSRKIQPYLRKLEELSIVRRTLPALLKNPRKTRKIRYEIADQLFRFWYRFVFPNVDRLEVGDFGSIIDTLKEGFDQYVSFEFERQAMMETARVFNAIRFGKFWSKWEELDFLGETKEGLIVGEFKWWRRRVGLSVLHELKRKCRKLSIEPICYILASREGFEKELFKEKDVSLLVLDKNDGWKLLK